MGGNSGRLWKKIAYSAGIASLVFFAVSKLCPNYVNENGWLIEPCFGFIPIAWFFLFICLLIFVIQVIIIYFNF
ncbi:MAG: hypothetical protein CND26_01590 [Bacteroidetes bacterium MED-G13]|nr:MAG: hypothetical protein CND26_01590 [Bacteroidetes bacterium MED-G13]